jgi:hypothetical protein
MAYVMLFKCYINHAFSGLAVSNAQSQKKDQMFLILVNMAFLKFGEYN